MAKLHGPNFARFFVKKPLSEVEEQRAGENKASPPTPPPEEPGPAKQPLKPWPTSETPYTHTNGTDPFPIPPTDDWEEPAAYDWEETAQAQEIGLDLADSSPLLPSRRPLYKRPEPPPNSGEQLANVIGFLQRLQSNIRTAATEAEDPSAMVPGSTLLQSRRLSRSGVVPNPFEIGVLPKPPKVEVAPPVKIAPATAVKALVEPKEALPPSPEPLRLERRHVAWLVLTGGLCLVTLGLVAYLWTRVAPLSQVPAAPRNPAGRGMLGLAPEQEISEEALKLANLALEAMQRGDFKGASEVLAQARKQGVVLPGLYYQASLLAFNQGQSHEADEFLKRSIRANEAVSDCWYLRANTVFYTEGPSQAAEAFEQAVAAAPFNPRYYFFRAECLRRNGNASAAVAQFQQALRCRPNSTDTELILFKIGLTKIETNADLIFKTELHDRLAQEPVSGDMLLLAAADAISRNEFPEAAAFLKRAVLVLPLRVFQSRIRDYVFQAQSEQPDIANVLKQTLAATAPGQPAPSSGRILIDPATRTLAEADPAGW